MGKALLIVDVQNDFVEGGALGVSGGEEVARRIARHVERHRGDYDLVVASRDWHKPDDANGGHIVLDGTPDFVDTWPPHCIAGTEGADYAPAFDGTGVDVQVRKGYGEPAYSVFQGAADDGRSAEEVLRDAGIDEVELAGLATDYCVLQTGRDALARGLRVTVRTELVAGVHPEASERALDELESLGARLI